MVERNNCGNDRTVITLPLPSRYCFEVQVRFSYSSQSKNAISDTNTMGKLYFFSRRLEIGCFFSHSCAALNISFDSCDIS